MAPRSRRSDTSCSAWRCCAGCCGSSSATAWCSPPSICITWGTNLFHYAVFDGTFSHAYAFFVVCVFLWLVERWWEEPTLQRSIALGALAGLNVLIRHTNAIYVLVLPCTA